jgi:hypothetical protein
MLHQLYALPRVHTVQVCSAVALHCLLLLSLHFLQTHTTTAPQASHSCERSVHRSTSSDMSGPSTPTQASTPLPSSHSAKLAVLHSTWSLQDKQQDCQQEYLKELQLYSVLGRGGFSTVYAGTWHGSRTAIKVSAGGVILSSSSRSCCRRVAARACRERW